MANMLQCCTLHSSLNLVCVTLCAIGLIYQTTVLMSEYMSGKSVANIGVGWLNNSTVPAFTLCFPQLLSIKGLAKFSQHYERIFHDYIEASKQWTDTNRPIEESVMKDANYHYKNISKHLDHLIVSHGFDVLFDNLTVPFLPDSNQQYPITINIPNMQHDSNAAQFTKMVFKNLGRPLESILNYEDLALKCFTLFSAAQDSWKEFTTELEGTTMLIGHSPLWFPVSMFDKVYLSMHSPNTVTDMVGNDLEELKTNRTYLVNYFEFRNELANNCSNYDHEDRIKTRRDCINYCIIDNSLDVCSLKDFAKVTFFVRRDHFHGKRLSNESSTKCALKNFWSYFELKNYCRTKCKKSCVFSYYLYNVKKMSDKSPDEKNKNVLITVQHNRLPDIVVRHMPETTFISLVCYFGGLLGMWCGLSVLAISKSFFAIAIELYRRLTERRKKIIKIKVNALSINNFN